MKNNVFALLLTFLLLNCSPLSSRDRAAIAVCNAGISISSRTEVALEALLKEKRISGKFVSEDEIKGAFVHEAGLTPEQKDSRAEKYHSCLVNYWASNK